MKKLLILLWISGTIIGLNSCGNGSNDEKKKATPEKKATGECTWTFVRDSSSVNWTAFKTTAKKPVKGWFDKFSVVLPQAVNYPVEALNGASFRIETKSIDSGNEERDPKLVKYFFGAMENGSEITGKIKTIDGNAKSGKGTIEMTFNNITSDVPFDYLIEGAKITLRTSIRFGDWNAEAAGKSLNNECKELHTGDDGVSKLWDEVDIEVKALLKKDC